MALCSTNDSFEIYGWIRKKSKLHAKGMLGLAEARGDDVTQMVCLLSWHFLLRVQSEACTKAAR